MRIRTTSAAIITALAITLVGCSSSDDTSDAKPKPKAEASKSSEPSIDASAAQEAAGVPPEPTGAERAAVIAALWDINPALVTDEDKAVDNARNQCSTINGGGDVEKTAKARFSTSDHEVTDAEARQIGIAVSAALCHD